MEPSTEEIIHRVMDKVLTDVETTDSAAALKKFHVSQTTDQLPDLRLRNALYRSELEKQILEKREAERQRKEREAKEEERLIRKIEIEREKLRKEYIQDLQERFKTEERARLRQQAITRRLEELRAEEARRREEEATKKKIELLKSLYYNHKDLKHSSRSSLSNSHFQRTTPPSFPPPPWYGDDYVRRALRLSLEEIYNTAPIDQLTEVYRKLEKEKQRIRDTMRKRIALGDDS